MTELHWLDAHEQAALLQSGKLSVGELVDHHLDRVERLSESLGAFITVTPDRARAQAREADATIASGERLGPLFGVPTAIKDLNATQGVTTTFGSALMRDHVPPISAYVVDLIEGAGMISLGKTNTPEFGLSSYTDNDLIGPARTPWDPSRNAGGSSGGAAAAVAAGLVAVAQGSDGGGSIRIPSSACGIFGFKPSRGRVSAGPTGSDAVGLAGDGTLSRSVRDAAALLDVLARPMPGDIRPLPKPTRPFSECVAREPDRLRIARWSTPYLDGLDSDPDVIAAWEHASRLLSDLGHEIVDIDNPFDPLLEPQFNVIWSTGIAAVDVPEEAEQLLRANTRYWRERGRASTGIEFSKAMQFLESSTRDMLTRLAGFDAFLTPTLARPPQPVEWFNESGDPVEDHRRELLFTPFTAPYNMSGQPAASLPLYWNEAGLPIGVMLAAKPGDDALLFSLCAQAESAEPWGDRRPAVG